MQNVGTKIIVGIFDCYVPKSCIISKLIQVQTSTDTNHKVRKCIWSQTEKCKLTFQIDMANSSTPRIPPFFWENSIVFIIDVKHQIRQYKMKKKNCQMAHQRTEQTELERKLVKILITDTFVLKLTCSITLCSSPEHYHGQIPCHNSLSVGAHIYQDLHYLRFKSHIQHSVSLI